MIGSTAVSTAAVFFSETVLSLYPILIKVVPTNLGTQTLARFLIYPLAALLVGGFGPLLSAYKGDALGRNAAMGALNVTHIAASYFAFKELPAGVAMSLFYTYPLWNLIGASLFLGESVPWHLLPIVAIALFGTFLVATSKAEVVSGADLDEKKTLSVRGILAALISSVTETAIFLAVRGAVGQSPFYTIHQLYLGGLPILLAGLVALKNIQPIDLNVRDWIPLLLFNGLLGFTGYSLRFWSINKMPTILFSVLSLFGVLGSFFFGSVLVGEPVIPRAITGAAILTGSIGYLQYLMHS